MLGQQVDDGLGDGERDAGREDRENPQHRAAVGQQQQNDDHGQRGVQQRAVDALEDLDLVRGTGGRAGDVRAQPRVAAGGGRLQAGDEAADVRVVAEWIVITQIPIDTIRTRIRRERAFLWSHQPVIRIRRPLVYLRQRTRDRPHQSIRRVKDL